MERTVHIGTVPESKMDHTVHTGAVTTRTRDQPTETCSMSVQIQELVPSSVLGAEAFDQFVSEA